MRNLSLDNINWDNVEILRPVYRCRDCHNTLMITVGREPVPPEFFRNKKKQKCLVECSQCGAKYITYYD